MRAKFYCFYSFVYGHTSVKNQFFADNFLSVGVFELKFGEGMRMVKVQNLMF